jgi:hypothetical protein
VLSIVQWEEKLLRELRKGATASWNFAQYRQALAALGFSLEVAEKDGRMVVAATATTPDGASLTFRKDPRERKLFFHELVRWLIDRDVSDLCSDKLGLPTVGEEAKMKALPRDITHTGTCGICMRNVKMGAAHALVHHGYQRPGDGSILGDCFGVGYEPYELSKRAVEAYAASLQNALPIYEENVRKIRADELDSYERWPFDIVISRPSAEASEAEGSMWSIARTMALKDAERALEQQRDQISYYQKLAEAWKLDDLPEVKLAKFKEKWGLS